MELSLYHQILVPRSTVARGKEPTLLVRRPSFPIFHEVMNELRRKSKAPVRMLALGGLDLPTPNASIQSHQAALKIEVADLQAAPVPLPVVRENSVRPTFSVRCNISSPRFVSWLGSVADLQRCRIFADHSILEFLLRTAYGIIADDNRRARAIGIAR